MEIARRLASATCLALLWANLVWAQSPTSTDYYYEMDSDQASADDTGYAGPSQVDGDEGYAAKIDDLLRQQGVARLRLRERL